MARYAITAVKSGGERITLEISGATAQEAASRVRRRGVHVVDVAIRDDDTGGAPWGWMRGDEISEFLRELGSLVEAGLSLLVALEVIGEQGFSRRGAGVARELHLAVGRGMTLAESMRAFPREFDREILAAVEAGEQGGTLPAVLIRLAEDRLVLADRKRRLITALIHPAITLLMALVTVGVIGHVVVPKLANLYAQIQLDLPAPTLRVIAVFEHVRQHGHRYLGGTLVTWLAIKGGCRWSIGFRRLWHGLILKLPLLGKLARWTAFATGFRIFAMLYRAGIPLLTTLEHTAAVVRNQPIADEFDALRAGVDGGNTLAGTAADAGLFDRFCRAMLETGEQTGGLDTQLDRVAHKYDRALDHLYSRVEAVFTPAMTMALIAVVGYVVYALYLPFVALIEKLSQP